MIIEDLIRLGKPLLDGGLSAREILELISDVNDAKVKNFFRHVFLVELPQLGSNAKPAVLPMQVWGQEETKEGKTDFLPDVTRALGAPFVLPTGGNPLHPQGRYGVPVYPCWDRHIRDFHKSADSVLSFLRGRLERTPGFVVEEPVMQKVAEAVHAEVGKLSIGTRDKVLGVLILAAATGENAAYEYGDRSSAVDIGTSKLRPGNFIVPRLNRILEAVWEAKYEEGKSMGTRTGSCSICGQDGTLVSYYCKAWPWALPEWNCPLPQGGKESLMVEGIALDDRCYRALTLGACVFGKLTKLVQPLITRDLFSPVADRKGHNTVSRRDLRDLPTIRGSAYLLPLHDEALKDPSLQQDFVSGIQGMLSFPEKEGPALKRYVDAVIGFDAFLPKEVDRADFRLTLAYFHGDVGRGDVHLRAFIQDVIPPTLRRLMSLAEATAETAVMLLRGLRADASEGQVAYYRKLYRSLPYLLARAYGGAYIWQQLETALHRRPLDPVRPMIHAARRMESLVPGLPDTMTELADEVIFHLTFLEFVDRYQRELALSNGEKGRHEMAMRHWKEMLKAIADGPVDELRYESPAEIGFACGVLLRQFERWYWSATKVGQEGKNFLKHRVLVFGSDLSPEAVWKRGLAKLFDVAARYEKLHLSDDFRRRVGVTLAEFERLQEAVRANRDAFMSAFWSGHALQGYDKPTTSESVGENARASR